MLLRTLQAPPKPGSLQEWICLLVMDRLEDVEHARFRALAQMVLEIGAEERDQGVEAFDQYLSKAFPGRENKERKKKEQVMDMLKWWVNSGPLNVKPMPGFVKEGKSRMVRRIQNIEKGDRSKLYSGLGIKT